MAIPEKLNIWDRFFNRYRKEIIGRGEENWFRAIKTTMSEIGYEEPHKIPYSRTYVDYKITDRLTGSEEIKREYLS